MKIFLLLPLLLLSCKSPKSTLEKKIITVAPKKVIEMKKTPCYGRCPIYNISIFDDKTAKLEGLKYLDLIGNYKAKISENVYQTLLKAFRDSNFFKFQNSYIKKGISDLPTTYLTFLENNQTKTIQDYYGTPKVIRDLEQKVANLLKTLAWEKVKILDKE